MATKSTEEFRNLTIEEATRLLLTSPVGLGEAEAKSRAEKFGYNEVSEKPRDPAIDFGLRLWGPVPWLLELAIVLSIAIGHYLESGVILALLLLNAAIGFYRTTRAQKVLQSLKKRLALKARILRDGNWSVKDSREIVPGDVISIGLGDLVPADAKIIQGAVSVDQSALTGESLPLTVRESGILYSSSLVQRGSAVAVVLNTGASTLFGKTVELVKTARPKPHQEELMLSLVKYSMYFSLILLLFVVADAVLVQSSLLTTLTFSLIFLIAAIPAAMPAVFTIVLTVGATQLARKGVLVTRLDSIEDAASLEVLCLDKTGTVTQNKLSVADAIPSYGFTKEDVAKMAALASSEEFKDMIDLTVIRYAEEVHADVGNYRQVAYKPFDPSTKMSDAVIESTKGGHRFRVAKGAPQVIMALPGDGWSSAETNAVEELSGRGFRVLAVSISEDEVGVDTFRPVGLLPLFDPPRPDSKAMVGELKELGVSPKMLTGDNLAIAREVSRQVGIGDKVLRMSDLVGLGEEAQERAILEGDGFAQVYPEDKYRIVKLLQSRGRMVGMTGDGVNDAPALKQAELGIAVQGATDVARASSSVVLTDSGMRVIIDCIKESRQIYQRLLTWILNRLTRTVQFLGLLAIGFFWLHLGLLSVMDMVLIVFASDFLAMSLATDNVTYTSKPNLWNVRKITLASIVIGALLLAEALLGVLIGVAYFNLPFQQLQTYVMLMLLFMSQFRVLIVRERRRFWSSRPGRDLIITVIAATLTFVAVGVFGVLVPSLSLDQVLFLLLFSALFTLLTDFPKYAVFDRLVL